MAHIYIVFDFSDEEKAQLARHKLETWKQAFRLDKKLLYKFDRVEAAEESPAPVEEKAAKTKGAAAKAKPGAKADKSKDHEPVKLMVRLGFSGHEKLSEQRWVARIPAEEPFLAASPVVVKAADAKFADIEKQFEDLA